MLPFKSKMIEKYRRSHCNEYEVYKNTNIYVVKRYEHAYMNIYAFVGVSNLY